MAIPAGRFEFPLTDGLDRFLVEPHAQFLRDNYVAGLAVEADDKTDDAWPLAGGLAGFFGVFGFWCVDRAGIGHRGGLFADGRRSLKRHEILLRYFRLFGLKLPHGLQHV